MAKSRIRRRNFNQCTEQAIEANRSGFGPIRILPISEVAKVTWTKCRTPADLRPQPAKLYINPQFSRVQLTSNRSPTERTPTTKKELGELRECNQKEQGELRVQPVSAPNRPPKHTPTKPELADHRKLFNNSPSHDSKLPSISKTSVF